MHGEVVRLTDLRPISGRREAAAPAAAGAADGAAEADPHAGEPQHPSALLAPVRTTIGDRLPAMCGSRTAGCGPCTALPLMSCGDCQASCGVTSAGFPQEGVDAALADFSRLAGEANAALLRDYVAAVLGRHLQPPAADPPASAGASGASEPATVTAQPEAGAAEVAEESVAADEETAVPAAGATAAAASAPTAAGAASAAQGSGSSGGRPPRHVVLQPIADKHLRGAVHGFFKAEPRLPPMRTETFQSTVKEGSNTVRSPRRRHIIRLCALLQRELVRQHARGNHSSVGCSATARTVIAGCHSIGMTCNW